MKHKNKKGGFTIVEVAIAVTVAVFVSAAALSVILMTRTVSNDANARNNAIGQVNAILECFKASENTMDFTDALEFVYGGEEAFTGIEPQKENYKLHFYFNDNGSLATKYLYEDIAKIEHDAGFAADKHLEYDYMAVIEIKKCDAGNFVRNTEFTACVYGASETDNTTADTLKIYDFGEKVGAYVRKVGE